jgi:hypothetical protein
LFILSRLRPAQRDSRIYIEVINGPFILAKGTPAEYRPGLTAITASTAMIQIRTGAVAYRKLNGKDAR